MRKAFAEVKWSIMEAVDCAISFGWLIMKGESSPSCFELGKRNTLPKVEIIRNDKGEFAITISLKEHSLILIQTPPSSRLAGFLEGAWLKGPHDLHNGHPSLDPSDKRDSNVESGTRAVPPPVIILEEHHNQVTYDHEMHDEGHMGGNKSPLSGKENMDTQLAHVDLDGDHSRETTPSENNTFDIKLSKGPRKRAAAEPLHLVGREKRCPRCLSIECRFMFLNNKSEKQPRYLCLSCHKYFQHGGKHYWSTSERHIGKTTVMRKSRGPRAKEAKEPLQFVQREKICPHCSSRNAKFKFCNNGKVEQPRYKCRDCGKMFQFNSKRVKQPLQIGTNAHLPLIGYRRPTNDADLMRLCNVMEKVADLGKEEEGDKAEETMAN